MISSIMMHLGQRMVGIGGTRHRYYQRHQNVENSATQSDLEQYCLGSATLNLWIEPNNPWPTQQVVDVSISGANADRQGCSASTQL